MDKVILILLIAYMCLGLGLAYWAATADKEVKKLAFSTDHPIYKIIAVICICLWPFLFLFYFIFKKEIALAKEKKNQR